jgi:wobble nucleotide-excising tRNase
VINRIQLLRNIGQFDSVDSGGNLPLNRFVLVYAENGRGKTTLAAILRSLASGDPIPIVERRRLASQHPPHVVLDCSGGQAPIMFQDGTWNNTFPDIAIFDDHFVDDNVCSGLTVDPEHRHNLHELVLGSQGVALNRQLQGLVGQIEVHISELRAKAAAIPTAIRGALSVDEFCDLLRRPDVDDEIQLVERNLAAAQEQESVRRTPPFEALELPAFDLVELSRTLELDLPALNAAAAARVHAQLALLGPEGETWVADGMRRIVHTDDEQESCPFCAQDLGGSTVIGHYQAYFGEEYTRLRRSISEAIAGVNRLHGREVPATFERAVRIATERQQYWSRFTDVATITLDTEVLAREWQRARNAVLTVLEAKQAAPLERLEIPEDVRQAVGAFEMQKEGVAELNGHLRNANNSIRTVKDQAASANPTTIQANLNNLRAIRNRHSLPISTLCDEYLTAKRDKGVTEQARERAKAALERYRADAFPRYQSVINAYLGQFNAGYRIDGVSAADTRGGPSCNYSVVINNTPVPIAGGSVTPGDPSFRNVLSSGDRNTLALAFFFAAMDEDPAIGRKVVVVDDPISSLDHHRSLTTLQVLRRLGQQVSQIIILSHNKPFLCRIWQGIDSTLRTALKIERDANGSTIALWDVDSDSVTEHDRRHEMLRSYFTSGPNGNSREVAESLRLVLEGFLRVAFPEHYPPGPRALGRFVALSEQRSGITGQILNTQDTRELHDLVEYANLFHHDSNSTWETQSINDQELHGFVDRVLTFAKR